MSENNNSIGMNELVDYQKKTYSPFMDKVMKFLWKCGGADAQILQYAPYSDHIKNAGIGGVVLATTVMATLAMGFAMHTIFASPTDEIDPVTKEVVLEGKWYITIPVALIWGLIIFNLDRFIVSTVKGDGTEKITRSEWVSMMPRLFMAILIGLTISAPLETYIFKTEIRRAWQKYQTDLIKLSNGDIDQQLQQRRADNEKLKTEKKVEIDGLKSEWQRLQVRVDKERLTGTGVQWRQDTTDLGILLRRKLKAENEYQLLDAKDTSSVSLLAHLQDSAKNAIMIMKPGFLDQIMMLETLSEDGQSVPSIDPTTRKPKIENGKPVYEPIYGSAFWPIWLVRLLFMIVEIAPVIFKFMIWKSSYDYMQDNVSQILEAKQGISLELIPDENNNLHKVKENYNARRIVEVAKRQNELEKENAIHAITLYAEKEREEIEKDPERFIQGDSNEDNKG
jgi:hypothetical protein